MGLEIPRREVGDRGHLCIILYPPARRIDIYITDGCRPLPPQLYVVCTAKGLRHALLVHFLHAGNRFPIPAQEAVETGTSETAPMYCGAKG